MAEFIAELFKGINLAVFCSLAVYLFIKKVKPLIVQRMQEQEDYKIHQEAQRQQLIAQRNALILQVQEHQHLERLLLQKIQHWKQAVMQQHEQIEHEQRRCRSMMHVRFSQKNEQFVRHQHIEQVAPEVIKTVERNARVHFENLAHQNRYAAAIIEYLEKSA